MKILLISTSDKTGGAAIACTRLMKALRAQNASVNLLVLHKKSSDPDIISVNSTWFKRKINYLRFAFERFVIFLVNGLSKKNLFDVSIANTGTDISTKTEVMNADIIHIHWINQGFLSLTDLHRLLSLRKPALWTMHDQWAFTGICHYTSGCEKYLTLCQTCPKLEKPRKNDISKRVFEKKRKVFLTNQPTIIGCSKWMANEAAKSALMTNAEIISIPNAIDTDLYKKLNRTECRTDFGFPEGKKLILFGAFKVEDKRKGLSYLSDASKILFEKYSDQFAFITFGAVSDQLISEIPYPLFHAGYISDEKKMVELYNSADVFVTPSLEDNLPNTLLEAMSCGTPCVGFNTGGIPEIIDHRRNGYVAEYQNAADLAAGIEWVLHPENHESLAENARNKACLTYSEEIIARRHLELYETLRSRNPVSNTTT